MPRHGDPTTYYGICSDVPVNAPKGPLCDDELVLIASGLSQDWRTVAHSLGLLDNSIGSIERAFPASQRLLAVLRDWRGKSLKMKAPRETAVELSNVMFELGRDDIGHRLLSKYQESFECA